VQNIFPADMILQMRRYKKYSNKYFYSVNAHYTTSICIYNKVRTTFYLVIFDMFQPILFIISFSTMLAVPSPF